MTLTLAAILDTPAAGPLRLTLERTIAQGAPVLADAQAVERIGLACLQVLAAGRIAAAGSGVRLDIVNPSPAFTEMATLAGLDILVAD